MTGEDSGMAMSQVFISYHRAQRKLARLLAHRIAADGHSVWWDRGERPGDSWSEAVSTALANSACVIVIWSRQAATSPWVLGEATAGYGRGALVSVMADKTSPPSPFDSAPIVDMQDWAGDSVDLAWIRLRDPIRAKLQNAEKIADAQAPLVPQRAPPVRVGFSSAATAPPPPSVYEERRGGAGISTLLMLALGGLGVAGWYYRDQVGDQLARMQTAMSPAPVEEAAKSATPPPPIAPASAVAAALPAEPLPPVEIAPTPEPAKTTAPRTAPDDETVAAADAWRDTFVPAPILRSMPRTPSEPAPAATPASLESPVTVVASAPASAARLERVLLPQGRFMDVDAPGHRHRTDIWFAPDRTGYGLFLGVTHGARSRLTTAAKATPAYCAAILLREAPIAARELARDGGFCLRSSEGEVTAWRVEGIDRGAGGATLRLRAVTS